MKKVILISVLSFITTLTFSQGGPQNGLTITKTITDGIWSNSSIWDNGVPTNKKDVVINHNVTITSNSITKNLTISDTLINNGFLLQTINFTNNGYYEDISGTVEIRQNGIISGNNTYLYNLSVKNGNITNTSYIRNVLSVPLGILDVSGGNLILVNDETYDGRVGNCIGNISGTFTWNKYINKSCTGWSMYGFPATTTLNIIGLYYTFGRAYNTYWWNETIMGGLNDGWVFYTSRSQTVQQGLGIINYYRPFNDLITLTTNLPNSFNFPITYTSTGVAVNDGWNLVGNPFPGTIDWGNINWVKTNVAGAIYTWSNCNSIYGSYIGGLGTGGMDGKITSGEGFWIQTTNSSPVLTAPKSVMVNGSEELYKMSNNPINYVRFEYNGDDIIVRLENGSKKFDFDLDAINFGNRNIYTSDDDGVKYSIDTRTALIEVTIPLWTKNNGVLSITENTLNGYNIYLHDKITNIYHSLNNNFYIVGFNYYTNNYDLVFSRKPITNNPIYKNINFDSFKDKGYYYMDLNGKVVESPQKNQLYIEIDEKTQERKLKLFYE